ncbi:Head completion protein [Pseudodesulfovibrio profundus]|uniref:Head completion protein n=1 Tax=Pseudodesulfovibrio profundus TaxID=57320 RepID=A0A2C8FDK2_9BACT|nr:head completion/stabilization protein [Pseudodesulfovibrio profundus]SOB60541.1 Head completion protein [Pseudodesulfovibrio profundus]
MSFSGKTTAESTAIVQNDGWWPDFSVADFQKRYRMPSEYAEELLVDGLQIGAAWANKELMEWKAGQVASGFAGLSEVPCESKLGNDTLHLINYRRAVYSHAKGYLLQQYPTVDRREAATNEARESEETESKFYEYAQQAISDILGKSRVTAVLL